MKNLIFLALLIGFSTFTHGQNCDTYAPLTEGVFLELTNYNAKGKATGRTEHLVIDSSPASAVFQATIFDKKDKEVSQMEYNVQCADGGFQVEMANYLDTGNLAASEFEIEMDGDFLTFPANMQVGDELEAGELNAELQSSGTTLMRLGFSIFNRKVEAIESITTPAGTFDCVKLSYDFTSKTGFINVKGSATEWVSENIGVVKSESYNKNGKLIGYSELTRYDK
ncbi:MAG: DUF3108 domain-containing protein [Saprospiraceae bacterium]|nr:DUF3108 domain-containing protein [Saprospiraceae bacterium]